MVVPAGCKLFTYSVDGRGVCMKASVHMVGGVHETPVACDLTTHLLNVHTCQVMQGQAKSGTGSGTGLKLRSLKWPVEFAIPADHVASPGDSGSGGLEWAQVPALLMSPQGSLGQVKKTALKQSCTKELSTTLKMFRGVRYGSH